jgi:GNAT superfamily N-acetyltransferase
VERGGVMRFAFDEVEYCHQELDALLMEHMPRPAERERMLPMRVDWLAFRRLEHAGGVVLVTARDDEFGGRVLGFVLYFVVPNMHHAGTIIAACDFLVVADDMRGLGIAANLMKVAEPILRERGVSFITHMFCVCYDTQPLFPKLGYALIEQAYLKELR